MADELYGILFGNVYPVTGGYFEPSYAGDDYFLREVIKPIYDVMHKVPSFQYKSIINFSPAQHVICYLH